MKKAFNIREILIILLIVLVFGAVFMPFIKGKSSDTEKIAKLRNFNKKIIYVHKVFYSHNAKKIKNFKETYAPYLRGKIYNQKYHYRYLNGLKPSSSDAFYFDNFIITPEGEYVGVKFDSPEEGLIFYDYNGEQKPNRIGKDIFFFQIHKENVYPFGYDQTEENIKQDCSRISRGVMCSMFYISGSRAAG